MQIRQIDETKVFAMNDVEYQIECTTRDLASYLVKDFSFGVEQSLRAVYLCIIIKSFLFSQFCDKILN